MTAKLPRIAAAILCLFALMSVPRGDASAQQRRPLAMENRQTLYQRVILRPGATLAERPEAGATSRPAAGFSVFYVYTRRGAWLEVGGAADGRTDGWVPAERTIDWKHTLVLAFNNPAGRDRAMFYADAAAPERLWMDTRNGPAETRRLREAAMAGRDGPVIALEPENFVDITRQFYLLPILSAKKLTNDADNDAKLLEVISAPAQPPRAPAPDPDALRNYRGAVVFVVDTTISMGPYIERTREMLRRLIDRIRDTAVRDNFRFGMVAFRDHMGGDARLEYVTKLVAAPDFSSASDAILSRLSDVSEAKASNDGFDEDSLAGVKSALDEVDWKNFGGRFVILITDAGARDANDPLSATRMGPMAIRDLARTEVKQVAIYAIHLKTPEGRANHARAERQYRELTTFGRGDPLYYPIPGGDVNQFGETVDLVTDALLGQVAQTVGRPIAGLRRPQNEAARRITAQAEVVGNAMRLSYLGRVQQQAAPDVVRSFVLDQDPVAPRPERRPMDVRVLLTRNQLSDLASTLRAIIQAQNANRLSPENFLERVQGAVAASMRDPRRIADTQRLGGVLGEYLDGLPYQSEIGGITSDSWVQEGPARRSEKVRTLEEKLRLYEEFNRQTDLWVSFDGGRVPGEAMYPVPLDVLP